jgi:Transcriptional regulator
MELKQIQCFITLSEELSFSAAAEKLYISQPSLSRHIRNLEDELGIMLFMRDKRTVTLTDAGIQFLSSARSMIHASIEIADTAESLRAGKRGKISIGYQSSARFVVPSILHSFCSAYPDITLDIEELGAEKLNESIVSGNIDIAFSFSVIRSGIHVYDHLKRLELFRDDLVAFAGYGHYDRHFRQGSALDLSACRDEILMQINHDINPQYYSYLLRIYDSKNFLPYHIEEYETMNTLMLMLQADRGIALLPRQSTKATYPGALYLTLAGIDAPLPIEAVWRPGNINPCLPLMLKICEEQAQ